MVVLFQKSVVGALVLQDPLHSIIDNTSMWNNKFGIGSAPPLKSGLRKMIDVVLHSVCDAFEKGMFGGEVWLIHKSMYGLSKAWYPHGLAKSAAAKQNEKPWWPVQTHLCQIISLPKLTTTDKNLPKMH